MAQEDKLRPKVEVKDDSWQNLLSGLGGAADKTTKSSVKTSPFVSERELTAIWSGEGVGHRIVTVPNEDMLRNWFKIPQDEGGILLKTMDKVSAISVFKEAMDWNRLYGGSVIVMGFSDGNDLSKPLRNNPGELKWLKAYPSERIDLISTEIIDDPKSPFFDDFELFPIRKINGVPFKVHTTRCIKFKGTPVPPDTAGTYSDFERRYWGMSALQPGYSYFSGFGSAIQGMMNMLMEGDVGVFRFSNMIELLSSKDGADKLAKRIEIINMSKSVINSILLGPNEEYAKVGTNFGGMPEMVDRLMMLISGIYGIPVTKLFGRSAAGENATGEGDARNYYDRIQSEQEVKLQPALMQLLKPLNKSLQIVKEDDLSIEFNPIWEPTQAQKSEMENKDAQTDRAYIEAGVLTADEVRERRFPDLDQ